ncbi:hypothetical protein APSETT444_006157 [Aspergillus pseudonomiae]
MALNLDPHSVLDGTSINSSYAQASPELQAGYGMTIKDALRVGLVLATVSSLGAVLYDWKTYTV